MRTKQQVHLHVIAPCANELRLKDAGYNVQNVAEDATHVMRATSVTQITVSGLVDGLESMRTQDRRSKVPTMKTRLEGGCLCGAVRYILTATPNYVYFCHCRDCQLESGSPFVTDMNIDRAALQIAGPLTRYTRTGDSGKSIHRNFCTVCGTTLLTEFDVDPAHASIKACSLDDPSWLKPDRHLFTSRTQSWLKLNDGLVHYERDC